MNDSPAFLQKSEELHQRVRQFARLSTERQGDEFHRLALDIARYQVDAIPGSRRLLEQQGGRLKTWEDIPPVYVDSFRYGRVAAHAPDADEALFMTSGTTSSQSGHHPLRTLKTYDALALQLGKAALLQDWPSAVVVALAEPPQSPARSSLTHMMQLFIQHFDGRALVMDPSGVRFSIDEPGRFLIQQQLVDLPALQRAVRLATRRKEPLLILATAFSLLALLEALDGEVLDTPSRTRIMLTGGFKGRKTELSESELRRRVQTALSLEDGALIGEYGMTELTSQLYEKPGGHQGVYFAPPWLRVDPVDPITYQPVADQEIGLARFIDLGNIDSAVSIVVQDQVQRVGAGIRLLGRAPRAPLRGCSLPYEALLPSHSRGKDD